MKIPKYIDKLLTQRTKLAIKLDNTCRKIDAWIIANNIDVDSSCCGTGVEIYAFPVTAEEEVRRAIEEA